MSHARSAVGRPSRSVCRVRIRLPCSKTGNVFLTVALVSTVKKASASVKLTHLSLKNSGCVFDAVVVVVAGFPFPY